MAKTPPTQPPGQEKMHTLTRTNPVTGEVETMEISQADYKEQHKELQAAGWTRVEEPEEPEEPEINPLKK